MAAAQWAELEARDRAIEQRHEDFLDSIGRGKPMVDIQELLRRVKGKGRRRKGVRRRNSGVRRRQE